MAGPPALTSPLAPVILRYLTLKTTLGRGYATERRFFQSLDAFLVADHAADLTSEGFDRWCQTHAHLTSGISDAPRCAWYGIFVSTDAVPSLPASSPTWLSSR